MEVVNIGLFLYSIDHKFLKTKMTKENSRCKKLFGEKNIRDEWMELIKMSIVDRLETMIMNNNGQLPCKDDIDYYISTRSNDIILTPLKATKINDPNEHLEFLFNGLVDDPV